MFLQSYVVPVVLYTDETGFADIKEVMGTSFFINEDGHFLSAKHVISNATNKAEKNNLKIGLVVKGDKGKDGKSFVALINELEDAPTPYDVTLGKVDYSVENSFLCFNRKEIEVWQEVHTYGYPLNAISGDAGKKRINLRVHKGIIQRILSPEDQPLGKNPNGFELNFLIGTGISGAPLLVFAGDRDVVIGICVGSSRSEEIDEVTIVTEEDGDHKKTFKETKVRISEFGIAQNLFPLYDWKPSLLKGKTLLEIAKQTP